MASVNYKIGLSNIDKQNMAQEVYERLIAMCFDAYSSSSTYELNAFVVYDDELYKCIEAISIAEVWNISKWQLATFQDLVDDVEDAVAFVNSKANVDGNYPTMTVGNADQLNSTLYVVDKVPYLHRTSGGSADIGNRSSGSIVGGSVVVNQQFNQNSPNGFSYDSTINGITITLVENQIVLNGTATTNAYFSFNATIHNNHKYLRRNLKSNGLALYGYYPFDDISIVKANADNNYLTINVPNGTILDNVVYPGYCVDLTQALGSTIADYIYDLEVANAGAGVAWFNTHFPNYPLDYNTGTLTHVEGLVSHDMIGFNQYNGDYARVIANNKYCISGAYTDLEFALTEEGSTSAVSITTENGHDYFTPTQNGFIFVNGAGADTCINLSWSGTKDGEYEEYVKHSYPLDNDVVLRGIPKLDVNNKLYYDGDIYSSDGKVARRYALVDLGTLSWSYITADTNPRFIASISSRKIAIASILCAKYSSERWSVITGNTVVDKAIGGDTNSSYVGIIDSAYTDATTFKSAMSGVMLLYELATPTEETFDPFIDPQIVNDWGTEEFVVETPLIPVGHDTKYPANLRDKLQNAPDLPSTTDDYIMHYEVEGRVATYVLLSTWLTANNYKVNVIPPAPATNGDYTLKVAVVDGVATYSWETI